MPIFAMLVVLLGVSAHAADIIPGPVPCSVRSVYDGDTFKASCKIWPGQTVEVSIRINGIDAPERRGKCEVEKRMALAARDFTKAALSAGRVSIRNVQRGKYAGRVLADVYIGPKLLADMLIKNGHARPYGGGKRGTWCPKTP